MPADSAAPIQRPTHTRTQHAIRLLVLMDRTGEPITDGDPPAAVKAVRSELRLQAMDFWMRNPDYLADELISAVESGAVSDGMLDTARSLLYDPEPDLHYYPMPRWFYGAHEAIDDAMALLETYGLATFRRSGEPSSKSYRNQMFLTAAGEQVVAELAAAVREINLGGDCDPVRGVCESFDSVRWCHGYRPTVPLARGFPRVHDGDRGRCS